MYTLCCYIPVAPHFFSRSDVLFYLVGHFTAWKIHSPNSSSNLQSNNILPSKPFIHLRHLRQSPDVSITSHSQCPSVLPPTIPQPIHSLSLKPPINTNSNTTTTKNNLTNTPLLSRPHPTSTPTQTNPYAPPTPTHHHVRPPRRPPVPGAREADGRASRRVRVRQD